MLFVEVMFWLVIGIGCMYLFIVVVVFVMGGYLCVGMEDNLVYVKGCLVCDNVELVEWVV